MIYSVDNCPFDPRTYEIAKRTGNRGTTKKRQYYNVVCAFDIEATRIADIEQAFMYVWQMQLDTYTVMGRTWDEFLHYVKKLSELAGKNTLVLYVHNLSYEFQFLQGIYQFNADDVFAIKSRKILKCVMYENIEFRCSYIHSNMSLDIFTRKMGCEVTKLTGTFDYSKIRYSDTILSTDEIAYCVADVISLTQAIKKEMEIDGDNIATIPLTSTGYVRRQVKETMRTMYGFKTWIAGQLPDYDLYTVLREAFRGGNTHASRFYSGKILENVHSIDRSSSYPDVLINCKFPVNKFRYREKLEYDELLKEINKYGKAAVFRVKFNQIQLIDEFISCPYLTKDKSRNLINALCDNGRILSAEHLETTLTDIDFKIVISQYTWSDIELFDIYTARYSYLPDCFRDLVKYYYKQKTELKGIPGNEIYYDKFKNMVNSLYGMTAQDPVKQNILYSPQYIGLYKEDNKNPVDILAAYNRKAFMSYAVGVWVTAHARRELQDIIDIADTQFVYADTDSVKYIGDINYQEYNKRIEKRSRLNGAFASDKYGNVHITGVYEKEHDYDKFITLGAKKYAYEIDGKTFVTCSGVNKREGGEELKSHGGLEAFKPGFTFVKAGGTEAIYNDTTNEIIMYDNHKVHITPNVVIKPSTYTLGITGEYLEILHKATALMSLLQKDYPQLII